VSEYRFTATLWRWPKGNWFFVTLPFDVADEIDDHASSARVGFGSVRVDVTLGDSTWQTSVFPSKPAESYVLPVKAPVRRAEGIDDGDDVDGTLRLV
jgi:hypothetical protein